MTSQATGPVELAAGPAGPVHLTIGAEPAEAALLGALLQLPHDRAAALVHQITAADLVDPRHRVVLDAIRALVTADPPVDPDPVTVDAELRRTGLASSFTSDRRSAVLLIELRQACPTPASAGHYLHAVLEAAWRRRVEQAAVRIQQACGTAAIEDLVQLVVDELTDAIDERLRTSGAAA